MHYDIASRDLIESRQITRPPVAPKSIPLNEMLTHLYSLPQLYGQNAITRYLLAAHKWKKRILVCGDYDVDGATSTVIMVASLRSWGFIVDFRIPDRKKMGYGLSEAFIESIEKPWPEVWITVDNGVNSVRAVQILRENKCIVLVTDHHLMPLCPSEPQVLVNPQQILDTSKQSFLAGVGVAWKILETVYQALFQSVQQKLSVHHSKDAQQNIQNIEPIHRTLLPLVALGTICDMVPLTNDNLFIVRAGLMMFRQNPSFYPSLQAMCHVAKIDPAKLTSEDCSFSLGPMLNAAGRISDMHIGVETLLSSDYTDARIKANQLFVINQDRKERLRIMKDQLPDFKALMNIHNTPPLSTSDFGIVFCDNTGHVGIIGLIASHLKEQYQQPAFVFTIDEEHPDLLKGSGRSVTGLHLYNVLLAIHQENPKVIHHFGGHAMAAGCTIYAQQLQEFTRLFHKNNNTISIDDRYPSCLIDGIITYSWLTIDSCRALVANQPYGNGHAAPIFIAQWDVLSFSVMKDIHISATVRLSQERETNAVFAKDVRLVHFNANISLWKNAWETSEPVYTICTLKENNFRGNSTVEILVIQVITEEDTFGPLLQSCGFQLANTLMTKKMIKQSVDNHIQLH